MKSDDGIIRYVLINQQASFLYSLIADGQYTRTRLGRHMWKSLIGPRASLQSLCSKEGFNVQQDGNHPVAMARARIGIIANDIDDCEIPDSRIGFGTGGRHDTDSSCGNDTPRDWDPDNGPRQIKAMGYILVQ